MSAGQRRDTLIAAEIEEEFVSSDEGTTRARVRPAGLLVLALVTTGLLAAAPRAHATNPGAIGRLAYAGLFGSSLHVINADGTGPVDITPATCQDAYEPRWAPGGSRILFINRCGPSGSFDISTINPDGTGFASVVATGVDDARVTFSPDGNKIAYESSVDGDPEIYVADATGSNPVRLTDAPGWDDAPSWSPDGSKIVFQSDRAGSGPEIYVMDADGSNVVPLTQGSGQRPSWSPDGGRIAFTRDGNIFWMHADGSDVRQLTTGGGDWADWSPDGTKIAYEVNRTSVVVANADGTSPQVVAAGIEPTWEPVAGNGNPSLWFTAPTTGTAGAPVSLKGRLTIPGGSAAGLSLQVFATPPGGSRGLIGGTNTAADGSFAFSTTPSTSASWVYEVHWAGDATHAPATFIETVAVDKRRASLQLTTSRPAVKFGKQVVLTVHESAGPLAARVSIFGQRAGAAVVLVGKGTLNAQGTLSVPVSPGATTSYFATFAGDAAWAATKSQPVGVYVTAVWRVKAVRGYATRGGYRLYHYSKGCSPSAPGHCPIQSFHLLPVHPGAPCVFTFEVYTGGRWHAVSFTWTLNSSSTLYTFYAYRGRSDIGVRHRVRATFPGDAGATRASSKWLYWMVTG
jgi:hypothetical protein